MSMGSNKPRSLWGELDEDERAILLRRIKNGRCTPFLGPENGFDPIEPASKIAMRWAEEHHYPLADEANLPRVAQFRATVLGDRDAVHEKLAELLNGQKAPDFNDPDEPHRVLASLPLPIYINTHYRTFIYRALKATRVKDPRWDRCRWREGDESGDPSVFEGYKPSVANPLVYYLFGHVDDPSSVVVTEDDHLDFLIRTSQDEKLIPSVIQRTFTNYTLLFLVGLSPFRLLH